jgi:hypothetical protein
MARASTASLGSAAIASLTWRQKFLRRCSRPPTSAVARYGIGFTDVTRPRVLNALSGRSNALFPHMTGIRNAFTKFLAVVLTVWAIVPPGPKYEEVFVLWSFTSATYIGGTIACIRNPRRLSIPLLTAIACLCGWTKTALQMAYIYDYKLREMPGLYLGLSVFAFGLLYMLLLNLVVTALPWVRMRFRRHLMSGSGRV